MISEHAIISYFAQAPGWALTSRGSLKEGWHAVYKGRYTDYDVYLDVDDEWIYMQYPLLKTAADAECKPALYEYLLRCNDEMFLAKLVLFEAQSEDGPSDWVALTTEFPVDSFNAAAFRLMAEAIVTYSDQYAREILAVALDRKIARLVESADARRLD